MYHFVSKHSNRKDLLQDIRFKKVFMIKLSDIKRSYIPNIFGRFKQS